MRTSKGSARSLMTAGGIMTGISAALLAAGTLTVGAVGGDVTPLLTIGAALFGAGVLQVPGWARRRREQFERIAQRLRDAVRS
jgi:hypothetical protein